MKIMSFKKSAVSFAGLICVLLILCIYLFIDNTSVALTAYTVNSDKLPAEFLGYKIALLSDFHNSYYSDQVLAQVAQAKPDIIILAGDMIHIRQSEFKNTVYLMEKLTEIAPVYLVQGNHEVWHKNIKTFKVQAEEMGVVVLDNQQVALNKGDAKMNLFGMIDPMLKDRELSGSNNLKIVKRLANHSYDPDTFSLLLMHRANLFDYLSDTPYDLVLAGHIHGGLIRIPFIGGLVSSDNIWFPKYTEGIYTREGSQMVVSRGLDFDLAKLRVFNGPEVVVITLGR